MTHRIMAKAVINPLEDDPFAHEKKKDWGFFARRKMARARQAKERVRAEDAHIDQQLKESELGAMESEEKLSWDTFELPARNRHRMIVDQEARIAEAKMKAISEAKEDENQKEEGFTCLNGFVQDFSRHRDSAALFHTLQGHTGPVLSFRLSSDFNYVVSCGADATVKLWDLHTFKCVRTFEGHSKAVRDCDVTASFTKLDPRAGRIVSGGADKTLRVWDTVYATCRKVIRGHTDIIYACCFSPDGSRIASASADRSVRLWDTEEGHLVFVFSGHGSAVNSVAFSHTGTYLLSSSDYGERSIRLWLADMPYMAEKQVVGLRVVWEVSGMMRRITVKYEPQEGFFIDHKAAKQEVDDEDDADEAWAETNPLEASKDKNEGEEEDEAEVEAAKQKELDRAALNLADEAEKDGFSISVNSVDKFGRTSQVNSYFAGVTLQVVLRGVDPFSTFLAAVCDKRAMFEAFDERSGNRIGTFDAECEEATSGVMLTCNGSAVTSRSPGLPVPQTELNLSWRAPSLIDRARPGAQKTGGTLVLRASLSRDPLTIGVDELDPGLVQLSYTLKEVDAPKKGTTLTDISAKIEKEEKKYAADLTANHQMFIDFIRNRDAFSAGTFLGPRCHMLLDGQDIQGTEKIMDVLTELMMSEGVAIVVKDARLLRPGVTTNSLERENAHNTAKEKAAMKDAESAEDGDEEEEVSSDEEGALQGPSDRALRRALVASAPPGPISWSGGPVRLSLRPLDFLAGRRRARHGAQEGSAGSNLLKRIGAAAGAVAGRAIKERYGMSAPPLVLPPVLLGPGAQEALSLRARAEAEVTSVLDMRWHHLEAAESIRGEHLPGKPATAIEYRQDQDEGEKVMGGKFGLGAAHYRMALPVLYPTHAISANSATVNMKAALRHRGDTAAERAREVAKHEPWHLDSAEREAMVEAMMVGMAEAEGKLRVASMGRRTALELMPGKEDFKAHLGSAGAVREYVLGKPAATDYASAKDSGAARVALKPKNSLWRKKKGAGYDLERRRNAYPTLPGFEGKATMGGEILAKAADLAVARQKGRGGLIREFFVDKFGGGVSLRAHHDGINEVAFSLDEKRVASGSTDRTVRLWDTSSGTLVDTLVGHEEGVVCVCFSDEGQRLLSGGSDNVIIVWNVATGQPLRKLRGHDDCVQRVRFFNDATGIVSCGRDKTVRVWYLTPQPPAAPEKPWVIGKTGFSLTVKWKAPPAFNEEVSAFHLQWRVGIREDFGHDVTIPGNEVQRVVAGLLAGTPYQFRVRAVNRMGLGRWSDPSSQTLTAIDVPPALERPEIVVVTPYAIGITWKAPTASIEGTSIGRFVIQLAGGGVSYEDKVQRILPWGETSRNHAAWLLKEAATPETHLAVGQNSNMNLEVLQKTREKREAFQRKQVIREKEKAAEKEKVLRRARWEKGDFADPKVLKRKAKEEKKRRKEEKKAAAAAEAEAEAARLKNAHHSMLSVLGQRGSLKRAPSLAAVASVSLPTSPKADAPHDAEAGALGAAGAAAGTIVTVPAGPAVGAEIGHSSNQGGGKHSELKANLVDHMYVFDGLTPGIMYRLRLAGVSSIGQGKWSPTTFSTSTLSTPPAKPKPPTVDPANVAMFSIKVNWRSPDEHGSAISAFTLRCCHDSSEHTVSQNHVFMVIDDLAPGLPYTFQVRATNQQGHSPWSDPSLPVNTLTSKAERPAPPVCADCGIDWIWLDAMRPFANGSNVVGFKVQMREIAMTSKATWGRDLTLPIIEVEESESESGSESSVSGSESSESDGGTVASTASALKISTKSLPRCRLKITGLWANKTYDFRIAAINGHGASAWSLASQRCRTKPPLKPATCSALRGEEGYPNALLFSWEPPHHFGSPIIEYKVEQQRTAVRKKEDGEEEDDDEGEGGDDYMLASGGSSAEDQVLGEAVSEMQSSAKKKDKNKDFHLFLRTKEEGAACIRVEELVTGSTYKFRCAAINEVGQGPWGDWTSGITLHEEMCGDPFSTDH